jgi:Caspase domain
MVKYITILCAIGVAITSYANVFAQSRSTLSVLAIGNAHYKAFDSYPDIAYSAHAFLNHFKETATPCIMESTPERKLSKSFMLSVIKNFVDFVEQQPGDLNIGIIYYCGHGVASKSGSMYFVPGDVDSVSNNMTFDELSEKFLNVDSISHLIIDAQKDPVKSRYVIMGDCCSTRVLSKLYDGITYIFDIDEGSITYSSEALNNDSINSSLRQSAELQFDSAGGIFGSSPDTAKTSINELGFIPELIRSVSMKKRGNLIYYSSAMGETTEMVKSVETNPGKLDVGPICRRTQLFFKARSKKAISTTGELMDYLNKLTEKDFDKRTLPSLLNRPR